MPSRGLCQAVMQAAKGIAAKTRYHRDQHQLLIHSEVITNRNRGGL